LLIRLYKPNKGAIFFDGVNIEKIDIDSYREKISVIAQKSFLFTGSVRNNIDLRDEYQDKDIIEASKISQAEAFIKNHLNLGVTANGDNISGGERQKIVVTRGVLNKAELIILDEATSYYDIKSKENFRKMIIDYFYESTIIIVTHDYSWKSEVDKVFEISDGKLVQLEVREEQ